MARTPVFAVTVVATLALAIGANSTAFSALRSILFAPLDFPGGDRLVRVRQITDGDANETAIAAPRLEDWSVGSSAFEALTGYYIEDVADTTREFAERGRRAVVAPRFLAVWGVTPALGRDFTEGEHRFADPSAILVSDRYWRTRMAADPAVLGRLIRIDGRPHAVVGVMPASFRFPVNDVDFFWPYPLDAPDAVNTPENRKLQWYVGVGRLRPGVTVDEAAADLNLMQARLGVAYPESDAAIRARVALLKDTIVRDSGRSLWLLFGAVTVLLLIACVNIASLLLARAARREQETAIRAALGASRAALVGQLLAEAGVLAFAGAGFGLLLALASSGAVRVLAPALPRSNELGVDGGVLVYTAVTAIVVTLLCGLLPALKAARGTHAAAQTRRALVSSQSRVQWLLVGVQVALAVTLLVGAGLLGRGLYELARVEPGFETSRVLAFRVSGTWNENYAEPERLVQRIDSTLDELTALPGVEAAATSWTVPGAPGVFQVEFAPAGGPADADAEAIAGFRAVSPEYFATMGIALSAGEVCRASQAGIHRPGSPLELMVNQSFANRFYPGRSVIGRELSWESGTLSGRVTGVVADARELGIDRAPGPTVYPCDSAPSPFPWYLVRTSRDDATVVNAIRQRIKQLEPLRAVFDIAPLSRQIGGAYSEARLRATLLAFFAASALLLACVGIYGTLSYVVGLKRREIGLRMAVGALQANIISALLWKTSRVVGIACCVGSALAIGFSRALAGMLYGISGADPTTWSVVVAGVFGVALVAALVPSLRASRIDPIQALREE